MTDLVGAVLVGGKGRRMGGHLGQPKELLPVADGRTMIDCVIDALSVQTCEVVLLGDTIARPDLTHLPDLRPGAGPLAGLEALLRSGRAAQYLICPCDLPAVTAELLGQLCAPASEPVAVFRVDGEDTPRPLPARIDSDLADQISAALDAGQRAVWRLISDVPHRAVRISASAGALLVNVNTPGEYEALRRSRSPEA